MVTVHTMVSIHTLNPEHYLPIQISKLQHNCIEVLEWLLKTSTSKWIIVSLLRYNHPNTLTSTVYSVLKRMIGNRLLQRLAKTLRTNLDNQAYTKTIAWQPTASQRPTKNSQINPWQSDLYKNHSMTAHCFSTSNKKLFDQPLTIRLIQRP